MVKGARQREWPRHLSTHTHTHWTLPTTMSVLETPFDIHVSSVYQTHTCMQAPIPTLCISAKKTHNKGSRTRPVMSTLMPRSGIPVICSRATLSCDSSYLFFFFKQCLPKGFKHILTSVNVLEQVQSAKYLGLTITDNLDWGQHVSEISCKATKTMGLLWRNLALAPKHTKEVAYKTLVRPQLEYAAPIWNPYHKLQIQEVEKVQRTAARWTCRRWRNTSSVGDMLDELEWPSLEARREQSSLTFFYKIHSGTVCLLIKIST